MKLCPRKAVHRARGNAVITVIGLIFRTSHTGTPASPEGHNHKLRGVDNEFTGKLCDVPLLVLHFPIKEHHLLFLPDPTMLGRRVYALPSHFMSNVRLKPDLLR